MAKRSERFGDIPCEFVEMALDFIAENGKPTKDKDIYYLERNGGDTDRSAPHGLATKHKGKWIGMREAIRVAFAYSDGIKPRGLIFNDDDLDETCNTQISARGETILKKCGHPCKRF